MENTIIKSASVKVMQSYNYCHFEACMTLESDKGLTVQEIDEARKTCQRLTNKAIGQYQQGKQVAANRNDAGIKIRAFKQEIEFIQKKDPNDRTMREIGMLKQFEQENWEAQFEDNYDYDDDDKYNF